MDMVLGLGVARELLLGSYSQVWPAGQPPGATDEGLSKGTVPLGLEILWVLWGQAHQGGQDLPAKKSLNEKTPSSIENWFGRRAE